MPSLEMRMAKTMQQNVPIGLSSTVGEKRRFSQEMKMDYSANRSILDSRRETNALPINEDGQDDAAERANRTILEIHSLGLSKS